jgi:hypothetical protein
MKSPKKYRRTFRRPRKGEEVEWDISQDQINVMVEEFLANKKKEEAKNPPKKVTTQPRRAYSFNGEGRGRPRLNFTKSITMVQRKDGKLVRADRGRPTMDEIRVKIEVPHNLVVQRSPSAYKLNKEGALVLACSQRQAAHA